MLIVERYINQLMSSNCYIVVDEESKHCLCIDPASEKSQREIDFIKKNNFILDYIIITHEHTDHNWGVNSLREHFSNSKLVCSEECSKHVKKANRAYFLLYYDDPNYLYEIAPADVLVKTDDSLDWEGHQIVFWMTPGHSYGSMCIDTDGILFTGDTIMPYKPYFNGRDSNEDDWKESIRMIVSKYGKDTPICPGHGDSLNLFEWETNFFKI